ncbi:MAG: squalene/phytoene synthase family protein [Planctomycetaceae bacterium]
MTAVLHTENDDCFIDHHLQRTSRTFALAIPLLAADLRRQVGISYLLFRVADSIEDAPDGDAALKKHLLIALRDCLSDSTPRDAIIRNAKHQQFPTPTLPGFEGLWPAQSPTESLLRDFPRLLSMFFELPSPVSQAIRKSLTSTITGMIGFLDASRNLPNQIQIQTVSDLRLYCYAVAGVVGELLTDLFVLNHPAGLKDHEELRRLAVGFGEFLQLINILKDSGHDATSGRVFIPFEASRENVHELATASRDDALRYICLLEENGFPRHVILYCRFLYLLADGSLEQLRQRGPGSKLTRDEVMRILSELNSESVILPV